jgi:hypothetical protein
MKWLTVLLAFLIGASAVACGDDDGRGGGTDSGMATPDTGTPPDDAGGGGDDAGGTGDDAGGTGDDAGGMGDDAGPSAAAAFCTMYESVCGFGDTGRHADFDTCVAAYDGYDTGRQGCVETHLGLAESMGVAVHCPHATGEAPCN